jgi:hypothetical protein
MNYQAFTNDSLTMMYEGIRGALAADDALTRQGMETGSASVKRPSGSCTPLISRPEMLRRGMFFDVIDWSEDQGTLPLTE